MLIDKGCLLTDQRWARADVELSLKILGWLESRPVATGASEKVKNWREMEVSLRLEIGQNNSVRPLLASLFDGL